MQIKTILRLIGVLLMIFSISMLTPLLFNFVFHENYWMPFIAAFLCTLTTGGLLWFCFRNEHQELKVRDGFLIVVLFWFVLCFFASLPFLFAIHHHNHSMTDALFESVSGFTTTSATILSHLDNLPHAVLFYRQQLQSVGAGMGAISITFSDLNLPSKWLLIFAMIAGRLEVFSILILFSRHFWQK